MNYNTPSGIFVFHIFSRQLYTLKTAVSLFGAIRHSFPAIESSEYIRKSSCLFHNVRNSVIISPLRSLITVFSDTRLQYFQKNPDPSSTDKPLLFCLLSGHVLKHKTALGIFLFQHMKTLIPDAAFHTSASDRTNDSSV